LLEQPFCFLDGALHYRRFHQSVPDPVNHRQGASTDLRRQNRDAALVAISAFARSFPLRLGHTFSFAERLLGEVVARPYRFK
jgi:hypothetical protein